MKIIRNIISLQILIGFLITSNYNTYANEVNIKKTDLPYKSTNNKEKSYSTIIKSETGITVVSGLIYSIIRNLTSTTNDQPEQLPVPADAQPIPEANNHQEPVFVYDRDGMVELHEQNLRNNRYLFDDDFDDQDLYNDHMQEQQNQIDDDYDLAQQQRLNNHEVNIMLAGEANAREYDNIKRQFINPAIPNNIPHILEPIIENVQYLFNNNNYHFHTYVFSSINPAAYANEVNDDYKVGILFFDTSNPNMNMLSTSKIILSPFRFNEPIRKIVPIIDINNLEVCQNNILRVQR